MERALWPWGAWLLLTAACRDPGDQETGAVDTSAETDTDADSDTDSDADSDTDSDTDTDVLADCFPSQIEDPAAACEGLVSEYSGSYYAGIDPSSATLKQDLSSLVSGCDYVSYDDLWEVFPVTDQTDGGTVWDMYSLFEFTFGDDQCGQYGAEGDCYNREHSWPRNWTNEYGDMKSDLFHIFPTDGYVNGKRGELPYGVVDEVDWTSTNGSLVGECRFEGRDEDVFEPIDEYKGDLARAYFYVAVRFMNEDGSWLDNEMVQGADIRVEAEAMLRQWHLDDPVSQKELDRNDAVESIQDNRNPFVDHPEWVCAISDF